MNNLSFFRLYSILNTSLWSSLASVSSSSIGNLASYCDIYFNQALLTYLFADCLCLHYENIFLVCFQVVEDFLLDYAVIKLQLA